MRAAVRSVVVWLATLVVASCGRGDDYHVAQPPIVDARPACGLVTCASLGATCGTIGDGCGDLTLDCGACPGAEVCGGGVGTPFSCGPDTCVPRTCSDRGATCGQVADGCGGLTPSCGTCGVGEVCGVGGVPNTCAVPPCTGLCLQRDACPSQPKTTITGTITAPGHATVLPFGAPDPIYGALVYIPNGAVGPPTYGVEPFAPGVSCDTCSSLVSEPPLVSATTAVDGTFTLTDVPCGAAIPLVIQLGRWRRQLTIPAVACCATTTLTAAQTHLPRTHVGEPGDVRSDIPLMAFSTGAVDTLHCVLRKIGVADSEFTNPGGAGRVHFYADTGARIDASTPPATALYGTAARLDDYDLALFECVGDQVPKSAADQQRVIDFANAGGRVFATHFGYVWLTNSDGTSGTNTGPRPFSQTATWHVNQGSFASAVAVVDRTLQGDPAAQARRIAFADWLALVGASTTPGEVPVNVVRQDFDAVSAVAATADGTPAQQWLSTTGPFDGPLQSAFDTPVAYAPSARPTTRCGRVVYSDFHVSDAIATDAMFPAECTDGPLTPQEQTLEFLLFDLAACVGPPPTACAPRSCADQGLTCGRAGDGCDDGVVLHCGTCTNGRTCGGDGDGHCGTGACVPRTCRGLGFDCGIIGDGCGGTVDCGACDASETCGGAGVGNVCGLVLQ
ncbi:MAG: hypothetical protein NT062_27225 [Proteobacteria bacterium]|nr:hypothetical protein [Pseudomonadota bacterium]